MLGPPLDTAYRAHPSPDAACRDSWPGVEHLKKVFKIRFPGQTITSFG
jgi:hypothetical protein